MIRFFRFPHTPHLAWLGPGRPRDDKVLSDIEARDLLSDQVVVEEKIDGANIGFSISPRDTLLVQNRGSYLEPGSSHHQFLSLWVWLQSREAALTEALRPGLILFGEWCQTTHSVVYDRLPDWFLGFDVYERATGSFWDTTRRNALLARLQLHNVPLIEKGRTSMERLGQLLEHRSRVADGELEGLIIRQERDGYTSGRAKLVRAEFVQAIGQHWSRGPVRRNKLVVENSL